MKTNNTLAGMILIMLCLGACRTSKLSNRQRNVVNAREQTAARTIEHEDKQLSRISTLTDSSGQSYQLTIFPADTFQFSMQNGFIGKASKVVLTGSSKQEIRIIDTTKFRGSVTSELEKTVLRDSSTNIKSRSISVEKMGMIWKGIGIGMILVLIMLGMWRYRPELLR